ncbi:MAG: major capsid protein, partial [Anaerolineae bacterium]|nr:major capsid protein [Anaerolineae bacterium]
VAGVAWNHTTDSVYDAPVIDDMETWTKLVSDDAGTDPAQTIAHMSTTTFNVLKKNRAIRSELSTLSPRILTPTRAEIAEILGVAEIKLVNDFYWDMTDRLSKHKYLPDGKVLLTTPYTLNGRNIAEMYDGLVARVVGEDIAVSTNPGMVADIYVNKEAVVKNTRVTTARMVILNHPEAFLTATVWS